MRRWLHSALQPIGRVVSTEMRLKTGRVVSVDFDALMASDIQGRARAFQSMVGGGMEPARAAALSGLLEDEL